MVSHPRTAAAFTLGRLEKRVVAVVVVFESYMSGRRQDSQRGGHEYHGCMGACVGIDEVLRLPQIIIIVICNGMWEMMKKALCL